MTLLPASSRTDTIPRMNILPTRADFLWAASKGQKAGGPHLLIQGVRRRRSKFYADDDPQVRVGFTASKKVGNAVRRARAKRRMRVLAQRYLSSVALPGHDYVFIARDVVCFADFAILAAEAERCLAKVNQRLVDHG